MASTEKANNKGKKTKKFSLFDALLSGNGEDSFANASPSEQRNSSSNQHAGRGLDRSSGVKKTKHEDRNINKSVSLPVEENSKKIVVHRSFADLFKNPNTNAGSFLLKVRSNDNNQKKSINHDHGNVRDDTVKQSIVEKEAQEKMNVEQKAYDRLNSIIQGDSKTKQPTSSSNDINNKVKQRQREEDTINLHKSKKKGSTLKRKILRERLEHYLEDLSFEREKSSLSGNTKSKSKKSGDADTTAIIKCVDGQVARVALCISNYISMDILENEDELLEATMHMRQWIRMMRGPSESSDHQCAHLFRTVVFVVAIEAPTSIGSTLEKEVRIDVWITCDLKTAIRASQSLNGLQLGGEILSVSIMTTARPVKEPDVNNNINFADVFEIDTVKENFFDAHLSADNDDEESDGKDKKEPQECVHVVNCGVHDYISFWRANQDKIVVQEDGKIVFLLAANESTGENNAIPVLLLDNLFTNEDLESYDEDADEAIEVLQDIHSLVQRFGAISRLWINKSATNEMGEVSKSMVCILFDDPSSVPIAARNLDGSVVGGMPVHARIEWNSSFKVENSIVEWIPENQTNVIKFVDKPLKQEDLSLIGSTVPLEEASIFTAAKMAPRLPKKEYCDPKVFSFDELTQAAAIVPVADAETEEMLKNLLKQLSKFQQAAHEKDPTKAKMRQRYVSGLKQSINGCKSGSAKLVVLSRDTESSKELDKKLHSLIIEANKNEIPVIFGLSRRQLGKVIGSNTRVATIAVYDPNGIYDIFKAILRYHESYTS